MQNAATRDPEGRRRPRPSRAWILAGALVLLAARDGGTGPSPGAEGPAGGLAPVQVRVRSAQELNRLGRYRQAMDELSRAQRDLERLGEPGERTGPVLATILGNRAVAHYHLGEYHEAVKELERAEALFEEHGKAEGLLITRIHAGNALLNLGRTAEAARAYRNAAALAAKKGASKRRGDALAGLALAYQFEGRQQEALQALRRARKNHEACGDAPGHARDLNNLGIVSENLSNHEEAEHHFSEALRAFRSLEMTCEQGMTLANLGYLALLKHDLPRARDLLSRGLEIQAQCDSPRGRAILSEYAGRLHLAEGRPGDAEARFNRALELAETIHRPETVWRAHAGLGDARAAAGDREAALASYLESVKTIEEIRQDMIEPEFREEYLADKLDVYNALIRLFLDLNNKYEALESLERRNRWCSMARLRGSVPFQDARRKALHEEEKALFATLQALEREARKARAAPGGPGRSPEPVLTRKRAAQEAHAACLKRIKEEDPLLYGRLAARKLVLQDFVRGMPGDMAVIAYFLDGDRLVAFTLTSEGLHVARTEGARQGLQDAARRLRRAVSRPPADGGSARDSFLEASCALHRALVGPLDARVHGKKHWVVLPDDVLWSIPFGALARRTGSGVTYVLDDHAITMVNTLDDLSAGPGNGPPAGEHGDPRIVAFGDPEGTLPASAREVRLSRTLHPGARVVSGLQATEQNVRTHAPGADIVVFASHAQLPPAAEEAHISLAASGDDDGRLTAGEIRGLNLKGVDLVVLSGCSTALSGEPGDTFLSLADAFLFAGARSVMATLWDVSDAGTCAFMERFISLLRENGNQRESLRLAQKACLAPGAQAAASSRSPRTRSLRYARFDDEQALEARSLDLSHPYFWAPFVLVQFDPGPVPGPLGRKDEA